MFATAPNVALVVETALDVVVLLLVAVDVDASELAVPLDAVADDEIDCAEHAPSTNAIKEAHAQSANLFPTDVCMVSSLSSGYFVSRTTIRTS